MDSSFIHVDAAIATAESMLPEGTTLNRPFARQWAYLALKDIGATGHWLAETTLYPNDNLSMKKPVDMWKSIDIALYGTNSGGITQEIRYVYRGLGKRIHHRDVTQYEGAAVDLSEDPYCFHLGSNGSCVSYALLKYWKFPIGNDGLPMIPDAHEFAVANFVVWMWYKRQADKGGMDMAKNDYRESKRIARSKSLVLSGIAMEQLAKEWVTLLNAPQFKQF